MKTLVLLTLLLSGYVSAGTLQFGVTDPNRPDLEAYGFVYQSVSDPSYRKTVVAEPGQSLYVLTGIPEGDYTVSVICWCKGAKKACGKPLNVTVLPDPPDDFEIVYTASSPGFTPVDWLAECNDDADCSLYQN